MKESERKYLIKSINSWEDLSELFDDIVEIKRISQTYLKAIGEKPSGRVRKTILGLSDKSPIIYEYNIKTKLEPGVHEEKEHEISKKEYEEYLKDAHSDKLEINKTRFVFEYKDQLFELDVFKDHLKSLAVLEIELKNINDKVTIPPYLKVIKEITKFEQYSNYNLAAKDLKK